MLSPSGEVLSRSIAFRKTGAEASVSSVDFMRGQVSCPRFFVCKGSNYFSGGALTSAAKNSKSMRKSVTKK